MVKYEIQYTGKFDMLIYVFGTNNVVVLSHDCIYSNFSVVHIRNMILDPLIIECLCHLLPRFKELVAYNFIGF